MEIIFLNPIYKDYIWGGERLKKEFYKKSKLPIIAESWEISANDNGNCLVQNKNLTEKTLKDLFQNKEKRESIFGRKCLSMNKFPLIIKYIDAKDNLSIQVHPSEYSTEDEKQEPKTEMWYILDCEENTNIIAGLKEEIKNVHIEKILKEKNAIENYVRYHPIKKGDSIYIPAGTIHAIMKGTLICEIQQNSDTTYRIYDWGRKTKDGKYRELHIEKALESIKIENKPEVVHTNILEKEQKVVDSPFFKVDKIYCEEKYIDSSNEDTFYAINIIEGQAVIKARDEKHIIKKGDSFIIPAKLGKYEIEGKVQMLKSYI